MIEIRSNDKFGRLTVLEQFIDENRKHTKWLCICDCGTKKIVSSSHLRNGSTGSCGCLVKERMIEMNFKKENGNRYGKLVVQERSGVNKQGGVKWECLCDC